MGSRKVYIGCSGYYYPSWKNLFYPPGLPTSKWLEHYSSIFNSVELNGTFYRIPTLADLQKRAEITPPDFTFSVKMSRYITHQLKLNQATTAIADFIALVKAGLQSKLD
jgi:uncharacterized protein YecE (DUF72 family)